MSFSQEDKNFIMLLLAPFLLYFFLTSIMCYVSGFLLKYPVLFYFYPYPRTCLKRGRERGKGGEGARKRRGERGKGEEKGEERGGRRRRGQGREKYCSSAFHIFPDWVSNLQSRCPDQISNLRCTE